MLRKWGCPLDSCLKLATGQHQLSIKTITHIFLGRFWNAKKNKIELLKLVIYDLLQEKETSCCGISTKYI